MDTAAAIAALVTDDQGAAIGITVGGLGVILDALASTDNHQLRPVLGWV